GKRYREDWVGFLRSFPGIEGKSEGEVGRQYLVLASRLHESFEPVDCLVYAGRIWEALAGNLHQAVCAPRLGTFLHMMMHRTPVHEPFPDFLAPRRLDVVCVDGELLAILATGDGEREEGTILLHFHRETVVREGPVRPDAAGQQAPAIVESHDGSDLAE